MGEWFVERQALVDVLQNERDIVGGDVDLGVLHMSVGGADTGAVAHRNDEEEPPIIGKERQHPLGVG